MEKFLKRFGLIILGAIFAGYWILLGTLAYKTDVVRREGMRMDQIYSEKRAWQDSVLFEIQKEKLNKY